MATVIPIDIDGNRKEVSIIWDSDRKRFVMTLEGFPDLMGEGLTVDDAAADLFNKIEANQAVSA